MTNGWDTPVCFLRQFKPLADRMLELDRKMEKEGIPKEAVGSTLKMGEGW